MNNVIELKLNFPKSILILKLELEVIWGKQICPHIFLDLAPICVFLELI